LYVVVAPAFLCFFAFGCCSVARSFVVVLPVPLATSAHVTSFALVLLAPIILASVILVALAPVAFVAVVVGDELATAHIWWSLFLLLLSFVYLASVSRLPTFL
jgi:hypothetical protein